MSAITGAISMGAQGINRPPVGHWLCAAWNMGAETARAAAAAPAPVLTQAQACADELVAALSDIAHGLENARIWGGMKWEYNPLHPIHYVPLRDKARAVLAKIEATGQEGGKDHG